jgi:hypothetical protein
VQSMTIWTSLTKREGRTVRGGAAADRAVCVAGAAAAGRPFAGHWKAPERVGARCLAGGLASRRSSEKCEVDSLIGPQGPIDRCRGTASSRIPLFFQADVYGNLDRCRFLSQNTDELIVLPVWAGSTGQMLGIATAPDSGGSRVS